MLQGGRHPHPPDSARKWLAAAGAAGWALGVLAWAAQALPATRMDPQWCFSIVVWLLALGGVGVDAAAHSPDPRRASRVLAIGVALQYIAQDAEPGENPPAAHPAMRRVCGTAALAAWVSVAAVHALTALGVWHFWGLNFRLLTLLGLAVACRCTVIRIAGPAAALAAAAEESAAAAARIAREHARRPPIQQHRQSAAIRRRTTHEP